MNSVAPGAPPWFAAVSALALVGVATALGFLARGHVADSDLVMLYLLSVVVTAARLGRRPALIASAAAVLAYDFFFVSPHFTFAVSDQRYLITFATLFIVGLAISALAESAQAAARKAESESQRSSLLSAVSHDLRTPLAVITGAATTLRDRGSTLEGPQRAELIDTLCIEADRMERLVTNLLDMSRLDAGVVSPKREWVPMEEVIGAALERASRLLTRHQVKTSLSEELTMVAIDPVLLEQLVFNLLENAARYSPEGSVIDVGVTRAGSVVELSVADRGPGLAPGTEALVFDKFYRGAAASGPGAGLGLAICRAIAQVHGGEIAAEAREGGGARFVVRLPDVGAAPTVPAEAPLAAGTPP